MNIPVDIHILLSLPTKLLILLDMLPSKSKFNTLPTTTAGHVLFAYSYLTHSLLILGKVYVHQSLLLAPVSARERCQPLHRQRLRRRQLRLPWQLLRHQGASPPFLLLLPHVLARRLVRLCVVKVSPSLKA